MKHKNREYFKEKSRRLRKQGFSLTSITVETKLPKSTVYGYIEDITLTQNQKTEINRKRSELRRNRTNPRKGICLPGRHIKRPLDWNSQIVHIVAHFMFDGHVRNCGCTYYSRSKYQIEHLKNLIDQTFDIKPILHNRADGVAVMAFHNVEFAAYIKEKINEIFPYLKTKATREEKRIFLKTFFDDEGNIYYNRKHKRRVRGYQRSHEILRNIAFLLEEFGIKARVDMYSKAVEVSGRENLVVFMQEISFSPHICVNPKRKNTIWKKEIEKREILEQAISSYR
ncbi:MAG: LAGLIDADG family homing endonuclease [Omnitrophica bacterium]|nr:LAGLIDADG family homing endonuclease [Candidatus Omnitrophota bacterium]